MATPPPPAPENLPHNANPQEPSRGVLHTPVTALAAGVILIACALIAYIAWRHPTAAAPLGLAVALAGVLVSLIAIIHRR